MKAKLQNENGKRDMILSVQNIFEDSTQFYVQLNLTRSTNYLQLCTPYDEKHKQFYVHMNVTTSIKYLQVCSTLRGKK